MPTIFANAAGIHIGADEIVVAVPADRDPQPVRVFGTFTPDLHALVAWLLACGIDTVAMESTGVYWLPLYELLEQAGIIRASDDRLRLTYLVMHAELEGLICSGAMRGKQHTYALLDERVSPARMLEHEEALAELTRRYFSSHGPATVKDCAWWSGLAPSDIRRGLELNTSQLEMARVDGQQYWFGPDVGTTLKDSPIAHLLPAYDEYTRYRASLLRQL